MLKFDSQLADILNKLDSHLERINLIIDKNSEFDELVNERISKIYSERRDYFHKLEDYLVSDQGKNFVANNSVEWDALMHAMQDRDKMVLSKISSKLSTLKKQLADINQNKSLFIYSKK